MKPITNRKRKQLNGLTGPQIYERIKFVADKRKIKIRQLALKAGFKSPNTIYNYKYGQKPNNASLKAIADVLNTSPEYLKGDDVNWDNLNLLGNNTQETGENLEHKSELSKDSKPEIADLNSPIFALNGQQITGEAAEDIRKYAEFVANRERNKNK